LIREWRCGPWLDRVAAVPVTAVLANAQRDLARYAPRVQPGFTPRQTYDTQRSLVEQTQGAIQSDQTAIRAVGCSASLHQPPSELQSTLAGAR
jgi:multidrug resistance efflux pump